MAEGSIVPGKVIRGIRAEEVLLRHFRMVTHSENCIPGNYEDLDAFCRHGNCRHKTSIDISWMCTAMTWYPGNRLASGSRKFVSDMTNISDGNRSGRQSFWTREVNSARVEEPLQTDWSDTFSAYGILLLVYRMAVCSRSSCNCYSNAAPVPDGCFVRI